MKHGLSARLWAWTGVLAWLAVGWSAAQTISGVTDEGEYTGGVTFTVEQEAGMVTTATLNGEAVAAGVPQRVERMDFYELVAEQVPEGGGPAQRVELRFIVISENRGSPERGLIEWTPYPLVPSTDAEMAGARLDLMMPESFPTGLEIPVVAWVRDASDDAVRVNGMVEAAGFAERPVRILRGAGSGFLSPAELGGALVYQARLGPLENDRVVTVDATAVWQQRAGDVVADTDWPAGARIHLTGDLTVAAGVTLTVGEGAVVKIDPGVNIVNDGAVVLAGTLARPVVLTATGPVLPHEHDVAWGGFVMDAPTASLTADAAILTGGGGAKSWDFSPGGSHRSEQAVILAHGGCEVVMRDCAVLNTAGQVGNGHQSDVTCERTLMQRAITCGEYVDGTITLTDCALIEFPSYDGEVDAEIAEADYDAIYFTEGVHVLDGCLVGFCKDDALDSGSGGAGTMEMRDCWLESALHEAMAWSGEGRVADSYDTVAINNGQGLECGWSSGSNSPLVTGVRMLLTGNAVGARFGDNYDWNYNGELVVGDSLIMHNYRDVWGYNWDDWTYRSARMDVAGNLLGAANAFHPDNGVWDGAADGALLVPFMTTPAEAAVGVGIATWGGQVTEAAAADGIPVRLSCFTTRAVSVSYQIDGGGVPMTGGLVFEAGETLKRIPVPAVAGDGVLRVALGAVVNGEVTGMEHCYVVAGGEAESEGIVARGAEWKYHDLGEDPGAGWREESFDDGEWAEGDAELGGGDGGEATVIDIGPSGGRYPAVFFRKHVTIPDMRRYGVMEMGLRRDDGAVVHVNGSEVYRDSNVPADADFSTYATGLSPSETTYQPVTVDASFFKSGENVIAVALHQESATSSDLSFDLELAGRLLPQLRLLEFGGDYVLVWDGEGCDLEQAEDLAGPWVPVESGSPYEVVVDVPRRFFRLRGR